MLETVTKMLDQLISQGETIFNVDSSQVEIKVGRYAHWHQRCRDLLSKNALEEKAGSFDRIQQGFLGDPATNF
jgi:hypothetical protein